MCVSIGNVNKKNNKKCPLWLHTRFHSFYIEMILDRSFCVLLDGASRTLGLDLLTPLQEEYTHCHKAEQWVSQTPSSLLGSDFEAWKKTCRAVLAGKKKKPVENPYGAGRNL